VITMSLWKLSQNQELEAGTDPSKYYLGPEGERQSRRGLPVEVSLLTRGSGVQSSLAATRRHQCSPFVSLDHLNFLWKEFLGQWIDTQDSLKNYPKETIGRLLCGGRGGEHCYQQFPSSVQF
jgi:hypothetical protein